MYICIYVYVCMYVCIYVYICMNACMYAGMYTCMNYVFVCMLGHRLLYDHMINIVSIITSFNHLSLYPSIQLIHPTYPSIHPFIQLIHYQSDNSKRCVDTAIVSIILMNRSMVRPLGPRLLRRSHTCRMLELR